MVTRLGFEPKTHSLEGCCSIQLSYQAITFAGAKIRNYFQVWIDLKEKNVKRLYYSSILGTKGMCWRFGRTGFSCFGAEVV